MMPVSPLTSRQPVKAACRSEATIRGPGSRANVWSLQRVTVNLRCTHPVQVLPAVCWAVSRIVIIEWLSKATTSDTADPCCRCCICRLWAFERAWGGVPRGGPPHDADDGGHVVLAAQLQGALDQHLCSNQPTYAATA